RERPSAARQAHDDVANTDHLRTSYYTGPVRSLRAGALVLLCVIVLSLEPGVAWGDAVVVALGDSLTAGLGVAADEAVPARLEARLRSEDYAYRVVNAGVSGDTTAGGLRRVDWVLRAGRRSSSWHSAPTTACEDKSPGRCARISTRSSGTCRPPAPACCWWGCACSRITAATTRRSSRRSFRPSRGWSRPHRCPFSFAASTARPRSTRPI